MRSWWHGRRRALTRVIIVRVNLPRRAVVGAGLAAVTATLTGCGRNAASVWTDPAASGERVIPEATAAQPGPAVQASPASTPRIQVTLSRYLKPTSDNPKHPGYAGAVAHVFQDGRTTATVAVGNALRYGAGPVELPAGRRVAMRADSIFDLASITKVYTAILVLQLVDRGRISLTAPVRSYLPSSPGRARSRSPWPCCSRTPAGWRWAPR
jgi:CubicO group peptidase (beta-lactamase class C family)